MKEFVTAVERDDDPQLADDVTFMVRGIPDLVDDREVTAHSPTSGQLTLFMAVAGDTIDTPEAMATSINFLFSLLDPSDYSYLKRRLLKRDDPFGAKEIADILIYLIEEWSARPTQSPSDSPTSRSRGGRSSTARRSSAASTR